MRPLHLIEVLTLRRSRLPRFQKLCLETTALDSFQIHRFVRVGRLRGFRKAFSALEMRFVVLIVFAQRMGSLSRVRISIVRACWMIVVGSLSLIKIDQASIQSLRHSERSHYLIIVIVIGVMITVISTRLAMISSITIVLVAISLINMTIIIARSVTIYCTIIVVRL